MRRQAPPLEAAEAFLAGAHAQSFRAAADAIALSPSAFSRRIQLLEHFVGATLFDRAGPVVELTEAGRRYYAEIAPAMETICRATSRMRESASSQVLKVVVSHSLAVGWLVPKLSGLTKQHGIEIDLTIGHDSRTLHSGKADVAIWGGRSSEDGLVREKLLDLVAVPASAARLADGRAPPLTLADLYDHRVLATKTPEHFWHRWLTRMGRSEPLPSAVASFDTTHLAYEAAASGLGITLAVPLISERFVSDRRLTPTLGPAIAIGLDYSMFYATPEIACRPAVRCFDRWIREEVSTSVGVFDHWANELPVLPAQRRPDFAATSR